MSDNVGSVEKEIKRIIDEIPMGDAALIFLKLAIEFQKKSKK